MAAPSACSDGEEISAQAVRNCFRMWGGNASKRPEFVVPENESFGFTSECCLFSIHHSKGQIKATCWLMLAFLIFSLSPVVLSVLGQHEILSNRNLVLLTEFPVFIS